MCENELSLLARRGKNLQGYAFVWKLGEEKEVREEGYLTLITVCVEFREQEKRELEILFLVSYYIHVILCSKDFEVCI